MSAVRANFNKATCTDATFAPSFNYATDFCADTTSVVSVFVSSVVILARIISGILLSVLIPTCE